MTIDFTQSTANPESRCPLTGVKGELRRRIALEEVLTSYNRWHGIEVPIELKSKYFLQDIFEFESAQSGLRWYEPSVPGEADFYEFLQDSPFYYDAMSWDKSKALEVLQELHAKSVVDVGCGSGLFLKCAQDQLNIRGLGVEINPKGIEAARRQGVRVITPQEFEKCAASHDVLVSLQTLEHVSNPLALLQDALRQSKARYCIIAVPSHETLLGTLNDPLIFPPHHMTCWSRKSLQELGRLAGLSLVSLHYDSLPIRQFNRLTLLNRNSQLGFAAHWISLSTGIIRYCIGRLLFQRRYLSRHSILGVFEVKSKIP